MATSGCESGHFTSQLFARIIKFLHPLFSVNMFCVSPAGTKPDIDQINLFCSVVECAEIFATSINFGQYI